MSQQLFFRFGDHPFRGRQVWTGCWVAEKSSLARNLDVVELHFMGVWIMPAYQPSVSSSEIFNAWVGKTCWRNLATDDSNSVRQESGVE